ncbi:hypothetical protein MAR_001382, partial [Mya arenaria]
MEESFIEGVADNEFAMINVKRILRLANSKCIDQSRKDLYGYIIDELETHQEIVKMARIKMSLLIDSYLYGRPLNKYIFETFPLLFNSFIVPKPLMNESMHHNSYMRQYFPGLLEHFDSIKNGLNKFINQTKIAYENQTINEYALNSIRDDLLFKFHQFYVSKGIVYKYEFKNGIDTLEQNIQALVDLIKGIQSDTIPILNSLVSMLREYFDATVSLMDLASVFSSDQTNYLTNNLTMFFQKVESRGQEIFDRLSSIENLIHSMWAQILNDEDSWNYYKYTGNTLFMRNVSYVKKECTSNISEVNLYDIRELIGPNSEDFDSAFENIASRLHSFKSSIEIDGNFV